jgi:hypothetical protein
VPNANSPAPNAKPAAAARRGGSPRISANSAAGATMPSGHQPKGAKLRLSAAPIAKQSSSRPSACGLQCGSDAAHAQRQVPTRRARRLDIGRRDHAQQSMRRRSARNDAKLQFADLDGLAAPRQAAEFLHQQAADRVVFLVGKRGAEIAIEIGDRRERAHREFARTSRRIVWSSSTSCSSSISPTICSMTSSMVTRPQTPPYSSTTIAM